MLKKIFCFSMFFFLVVALVLYMSGVRRLDYENISKWLTAVMNKFSSLREVRVPDIGYWEVDLNFNPAWYEYVAAALSYLVNLIVGFFNVIVTAINTLIGIFKFAFAIWWTFFESVALLFQ